MFPCGGVAETRRGRQLSAAETLEAAQLDRVTLYTQLLHTLQAPIQLLCSILQANLAALLRLLEQTGDSPLVVDSLYRHTEIES